jgi:hypothetical protein
MDEFVARKNVKLCRQRLRSETDPTRRAILQEILVEEEDKIGATAELVDDIRREIARARALIDERRMLAATADCADDAKALFNGLVQTQALHEQYLARLRPLAE